MSQGKFSNPRPHRDEERQIEQAFRQLTGQEPVKEAEDPVLSRQLTSELPADLGAAFEPDFDIDFEPEFQTAVEPTPASPARGAYEKPPVRDIPKREVPPRNYRPEPVSFEEHFGEGNEDFLDKAMAFIRENKKLVLAFLCAAALLLLVLVVSIFFFGGTNAEPETIFQNVYIADIHVGGMTKNEAISLVKQNTSQTYGSQDMVVDLAGTEIALKPKNTKATLDVKAAVDAAYAYGRTGTEEERERSQAMLRSQPYIIAVLPYLDLDTDYILDTLTSYAEDIGSTLTQTSYGLEGDKPELDGDKFNALAPTQTLVITMGTPGVGFDAGDVYDQVLDAYSLHRFKVTVEDVENVKDPEPIDLEAIYREFYIAPRNASVDMQTFETTPGSYGYGFDMDAAQKLLDRADFGEEIRIPMEYIEPEILNSDMFFQDALGSVKTTHQSESHRDKNIYLACEAINGLVLNPGEKFSFNDVVGQRSAVNGYKSAVEVWGDDEEAAFIGGGIGQVASTLYHCALLSDLEVTYRVNQDFAPAYIEAGLDVSVGWRSPDFQFVNSTGYPIQIEASGLYGVVEIQILGTDERQYYVEIESVVTDTEKIRRVYEDYEFDNKEKYKDGEVIREGIAGFTVKTYKYKYDKATGDLISKDYIATSQYGGLEQIVARVKPEETTEATTEATEPETEPTTAPTTKPTQPPTVPTEPPTVPTEPPTAPTEPATVPTVPEPQPTAPAETLPQTETEPDPDTIRETEPATEPNTIQETEPVTNPTTLPEE